MKKILIGLALAAILYTAEHLAPERSTVRNENRPLPAETPHTSRRQDKRTRKDTGRTATVSRPKGLEIPAYLTDRPEEIVAHEGYTVSFNRKHKLPNWVAWVLTRERTRGTVKRSDVFQPDPDIRKGQTAEDADYRRSGYDRGHMCPAADNKFSKKAMEECFYLSNICPQTHSLNAGDWKELEEKCRRWAVRYDSLYIVCGPVIRPADRLPAIGANRISVPRSFYKVLMRIDRDGKAQAIGFVCQQEDKDRPLSRYATSVDEVERLTGINFFSKLPKELERKAEADYDLKSWEGLK